MEPKRPYTETEPETAAETAETVTETAETAAEAAAPKKPREPFFRRQRRELSDAWREIYCNSRVRPHPHMADRGVRAHDRRGGGHGHRRPPAYWVGAGLLALLCVRQLFDRPAGAALRCRCRALRRDRRAHRHFCRRAAALSAVRA